MTTATSRTFRHEQGEAVSLPQEVAYGREVELTVVRSGDTITMYPAKLRSNVQRMLAELARLPRPATVEVRDTEEIPERPGL